MTRMLPCYSGGEITLATPENFDVSSDKSPEGFAMKKAPYTAEDLFTSCTSNREIPDKGDSSTAARAEDRKLMAIYSL
jgi:hypothetical protein